MEAKAKSGTGMPKVAPTSKAERKEAATSRKADPAPVDPSLVKPPPPSAEPKNPAEDEAAGQTGAPESDEVVEAHTDSLEALKPFLIGGAIIAAGAILVGVLLLARRN